MPTVERVDATEVERVLASIRPALLLDAGGVRLLEVAGCDAWVQLLGSCRTCRSRSFTLRHGIEAELRRQIPGFGRVLTTETTHERSNPMLANPEVAVKQFRLAGMIDIHNEATSRSSILAAQAEELEVVVLKWPGGPDSSVAAQLLGDDGGTRFLGGVVLDRVSGGLNPDAVHSSAALGGVFVWMPVQDALHHRRNNDFPTSGAISLIDADGRITPEALAVLDAVVQEDSILGTGHTSPAEVEALVDVALDMGVRRIILNHPLLIGFDLELLHRLSRPGVYFEHCYVPNHPQYFDIGRVAAAVDELGIERSLIGDFGVYGQEPNIADALMQYGMDEQTLRTLCKDIPQKILEL